MINPIFEQVKCASRSLTLIPDNRRDEILLAVADAIGDNEAILLEANAKDLSRMEKSNPLYDRLQLTHDRLCGIASDMRHVAALPSPLGKVLKDKVLDNGLHLRRVSVPFGVIGMVFEARPNVAFDVFSLCFKSGNACVLKGGRDADDSNRAIVSLIHGILRDFDVDPNVVALLPATHEATAEMLNAVGYVDVCIPRGGRRLIDFVRDNAKVPVIETGAGVVHAYFDKEGDLEKGKRIINNAKTRRVSVCNALDCLLVHKDRAAELDALLAPMKDKVTFHYDNYGTEWMSYDLSIKIVDSLEEAISHIAKYGSGHSECIITEDKEAARTFQTMVDAACVYVNAPTSFTDGAQFGLGAEIGISTQKLGPRGPMALEEITTYKWLIDGDGQIRP
ncbi:MAG: glutamate-5-semialdehyde dehydrogenase [Prevotella sp.]|nr:glutamate-5-semialdehyde dehydrogenase [Prevotella sp.]MCI6404677.1 glutamate-5-semialdehyde dehydrogenase [Prevotella sp.]MCI6448497.1 glutamate-5-semialdehyde dehydrogenase [Prevotella sp.]MCI6804744.1 glutamate-5-semialdehyde dehydrogenase [Prevotella sp.]MCI7270429.1 glutamate-5-semialdehyde dehydrogenase [Prevotella sp.]